MSNYLKASEAILQEYNEPNEKRINHLVHCLTLWLHQIAQCNGTDIATLATKIFSILDGNCGKMNSIVLLGETNAGKTTLLEWLSSVWKREQIGMFRIPLSNQVKNFWLQDLCGKECYRSDECLIENEFLWQDIKALLEENQTLLVENKNKSINSNIQKRPVLISSNALNVNDFCKWFSSEKNALLSRALVLKMPSALCFSKFFTPQDRQVMSFYGRVVVSYLCNKYYADSEERKNEIEFEMQMRRNCDYGFNENDPRVLEFKQRYETFF